MAPEEADFRIFRFNPERDKAPYYGVYKLEVHKGMTVLDGLKRIKDEIDGSLTMRHSCRQGICGSCAVRVNLHSKLACRTQVLPEVEKFGEVRIDPMGNLPTLKDLVADMAPFWKHIYALRPWLITDPSKPVPEREYILSREQLQAFKAAPNCIFCGCCHSACTAAEVDPGFAGPAALSKLYRFAVDPRDDGGRGRFELATMHGLWVCVRCHFCVDACPKDVRPGELITRIRELAFRELGVVEEGSRHAEAFHKNIRRTGLLDERRLALDTLGRLAVLKQLGQIVRMWRRGKAPPPAHPIPGIEGVRRLYDLAEGEESGR